MLHTGISYDSLYQVTFHFWKRFLKHVYLHLYIIFMEKGFIMRIRRMVRNTTKFFFMRPCDFLCEMLENYFSQLKVSMLLSSLKKETIGVFRVHIYYCTYLVQDIGVLGYLAISICNIAALYLSLSTDIQAHCGVQDSLDLTLSLLGEYLKNFNASLNKAFMG